MEIHFQTTDHVVAVEIVAEQHIGTKYSKCNSFRVISHRIILAKIENFNYLNVAFISYKLTMWD